MTDNAQMLTELMAIAIPVTAADRSQAKTFAAEQRTQARAEQVYRNTIAVLVTHRYLQLLGIAADLERSDSWNPLHRQLEDVADLYIPQSEGHLECRTIRPGDSHCSIPEAADRIGCVVIQLDDADRNCHVLGFIPSVSTSVALSDLQPLDVLIDYLCPIHLEAWFKQAFDQGWQPCDRLIQSQHQPVLPLTRTLRSRLQTSQDDLMRRVEQLWLKQVNLAAVRHMPMLESEAALVQLIQTVKDDESRWQAAELLWQIDPHHPACPVISVKDLGIYLKGHQVALVVGILPKADDGRLILLRVYPLEQKLHLPAGLKLMGLDETGKQLFQVESRPQDNYIQFKFTADVGDRFTARLVLNEAAFTENFVI